MFGCINRMGIPDFPSTGHRMRLLTQYNDITNEIESLLVMIKRYTDVSVSDTLKQMLNKTYRSYTFVKIKNAAEEILGNLLELFLKIANYNTEMDVRQLKQCIREIIEALDLFYLKVHRLAPSNTSYLLNKIKEFYREYEEKARDSKKALYKHHSGLKSALQFCSLRLEIDTEQELLATKHIFILGKLRYGSMLQGLLPKFHIDGKGFVTKDCSVPPMPFPVPKRGIFSKKRKRVDFYKKALMNMKQKECLSQRSAFKDKSKLEINLEPKFNPVGMFNFELKRGECKLRNCDGKKDVNLCTKKQSKKRTNNFKGSNLQNRKRPSNLFHANDIVQGINQDCDMRKIEHKEGPSRIVKSTCKIQREKYFLRKRKRETFVYSESDKRSAWKRSISISDKLLDSSETVVDRRNNVHDSSKKRAAKRSKLY